jgi:Mechanosensitive ion channel, beta-domain
LRARPLLWCLPTLTQGLHCKWPSRRLPSRSIVGDQIIVSHSEGTVEDIQTRATLLKTYDGRRMVIPNAELFTDSVTANTAFDARRLEYDVGIGYGDDIDRAKALILEAITKVAGVSREPPPEELVTKLADSRCTSGHAGGSPRRANALDLQDQVLAGIKHTFVAHGIDIPFPTQQIFLHDQMEETNGDRTRQRERWPAGKRRGPEPRNLASVLGRLVEARASRDTNVSACPGHERGECGPTAGLSGAVDRRAGLQAGREPCRRGARLPGDPHTHCGPGMCVRDSAAGV